jgi:hypothetical protein
MVEVCETIMNYTKKRKRQSGRQARQVQDCYKIWIDDEAKIHATVVKARKKDPETK